MSNSFVHLRTHSEFSVKNGIITIKDIIKKAKTNNQPAVALTDLHNMFGSVKFYNAAKGEGIQSIIGCDVNVKIDGVDKPSRMLLIAKNKEGYLELSKLLSNSFSENIGKDPLIEINSITNNNNLVVLSGGIKDGILGKLIEDGNIEEAKVIAKKIKEQFGDNYYIELQRYGLKGTNELVNNLLEIADELSIPVVATHPVQFANKEDYLAHETKVCISNKDTLLDINRKSEYVPEQYFKSTDEMIDLFKDIPDAIQNSVNIGCRCSFEYDLGKNYLPDFHNDEGLTLEDYFRKKSKEGLIERLKVLVKRNPDIKNRVQEYKERLEIELDTIVKMGFPGYFMIVSDFIKYAKDNDIPVGPGRGSGAGSLVAYALKITELDPLEYQLLFERFLNPERVSMPDFDIDFCIDGREQVINYVKHKYGEKAVSQIATFGTLAAKAVLKDVGRVLNYNYNFMDEIVKLIPRKPLDITLEKAIEMESKLQERIAKEKNVKTLFDIALKIEGLTRSVGKHAAGVLISPTTIDDFTPLYYSEDGSSVISHYDKDDVEKVGLVKFDFLGLRNLTVMKEAIKLINKRDEFKDSGFDIDSIPLNDKNTLNLFQNGNTVAVFQFESVGMQRYLKMLAPDRIDDLIAMNALYRPGPLGSGMVDSYIKRKKGEEEIDYLHPLLEDILKPTYGIIVYQEQVMQIAQKLSGYTLGGADILRRAMGKKKPEEMAKQKSIFVEGALKNDVPEETSEHIFKLIEYFAEYGFNKSHSAAYAIVAYQTAYLKSNYKEEYYAAVMNSELDSTDQLAIFFKDAKDNKLIIELPDVNKSNYKFQKIDDNRLSYALGALKGVGEQAALSIEKSRNEGGEFTDFFNFVERVDKYVNKRAIESLIKAGAFDSMNPNRSQLLESVEDALNYRNELLKKEIEVESALEEASEMFAESKKKKKKKKLLDADGNEIVKEIIRPTLKEVSEWNLLDKLAAEKKAFGFYVSATPFDYYKNECEGVRNTLPICNMEYAEGVHYVSGVISKVKVHTAKNGKKMAFLRITDGENESDVTIFSELYNEKDSLLKEGEFLLSKVKISDNAKKPGTKNIIADEIYNFVDATNILTNVLNLGVKVNTDELDKVSDILQKYAPKNEKEEINGEVKIWGIKENNERTNKPIKVIYVNINTPMVQELKELLTEKYVYHKYKPSQYIPLNRITDDDDGILDVVEEKDDDDIIIENNVKKDVIIKNINVLNIGCDDDGYFLHEVKEILNKYGTVEGDNIDKATVKVWIIDKNDKCNSQPSIVKEMFVTENMMLELKNIITGKYLSIKEKNPTPKIKM